jgi:hypothetical protein
LRLKEWPLGTHQSKEALGELDLIMTFLHQTTGWEVTPNDVVVNLP